MKKIIFFMESFFLSFVFVCTVNAQRFVEEVSSSYYFQANWGKGANNIYNNFRKFTSNTLQPYYNITPKQSIFSNVNYNEILSTMDPSSLEKISKMIHYGYGYLDRVSDAYYFATQYLIFEEVSDATIRVVDQEKNPSSYLSKEIEEIKKDVFRFGFSLSDFEVFEDSILLTDAYILENFTVSGHDIEVESLDDSIRLTFLGDSENYVLHFLPKNPCKEVSLWEGGIGVRLIQMQSICEKDYTVSVLKKREEKKEDFKIENDLVLEKNEEVIPLENEEYLYQEVKVPSTDQYSLCWLYFLLLMGNLYYVCKK